MKVLNSILSSAIVAVMFAAAAGAQTSSGVISGRIQDHSGLSVAAAEVTLTNTETGEARSAKSDGQGDFVFTTLQPGKFRLQVKAEGFKLIEQKDLKLEASERLSTGVLTLEVGTVKDSIVVEASITPVQTTSPERSGVLNDTQLETLSSVGRDFISLLSILPGVSNDGGSAEGLGVLGTPTISGVRSEYNNINVDGVSGNVRGLGSLETPINLDAVDEVKVLTSNYQAEYGKGVGAVINAVTKSGKQAFHGGAYYYKRHEEFNANNYFYNQSGRNRPIYRYNTFGYNLGGPVFIPGKFNTSRTKLFFFFSQEILPNKRPGSLKSYTVPTAAERAGDFSASVDNSGKPITVKDTLNNGAEFPNRVIPASRINRETQKLVNLLPLPNFSNIALSKYAYNYQFADVVENPVHQEITRVDYIVSDKWKTYFRGTNMAVGQSGYTSTANKMSWGPVPIKYDTTNPGVGFNVTTIVSPTVINEFVAGLGRWTEDQGFVNASDLAKLQRSTYGIALGQLYPANNPMNLLPEASFGVTNSPDFAYDQRFPMHNGVVSITLTDGVSKVWRNHTFKFGGDAEGNEYIQPHHSGSGNSFAGKFSFNRNTSNALDSNYAFSNALLGVFGSYNEATNRPDYRPDTRTLEWYAQDNWKVTRRLTLDYGVRFSWAMSQYSKNNQISNLDFSLYNRKNAPMMYVPAKDAKNTRVAVDPRTGVFYPAAYIGLFVPDTGNPANGAVTGGTAGYPRGLVNGQGVLPAPRVGFAYDVFGDGKTAIRGGFGVFYNTRARCGQEGDMTFNPPIVNNMTEYYGTVAGFMNAQGLQSPSNWTQVIEMNPKMLTVYNMSFGIQRNIGFGTVLDVAYVGTMGRHLGQKRDLNLLPYGVKFLPASIDATNSNKPLPDSFLRPYPGYGTISYLEFAGNSSYNSMQTQLKRRFAKGVTFGVAWTWSKAMDATDSYNGTIATYLSPRAQDWGKAGFDRTHIVSANWLWDIPRASKVWNNSVVKAVADKWQLSGIVSFISGQPLGINGYKLSDGADITGGGDGWTAVVLRNPALPKDQRTFDRFFDPSAFTRPAQGTIGNTPKDVFRGPGVNNWNLTLFKNIPLREKWTLQLRTEAYNAFNHTQFSGIARDLQFDLQGNQVNQQAGTVTSARNPRVMQFALRLRF